MSRLGALLLALSICACRDQESAAPPPVPQTPAPAPGHAEARPAEPRRALWVLAEGSHRALEAPERIDALVERATQLGVTDLFV